MLDQEWVTVDHEGVLMDQRVGTCGFKMRDTVDKVRTVLGT